jgi:hypothetical protein
LSDQGAIACGHLGYFAQSFEKAKGGSPRIGSDQNGHKRGNFIGYFEYFESAGNRLEALLLADAEDRKSQ